MQYYFILGLNPELSIAEICAFFNKEKINFKVINYSRAALLLDLTKEIDAENILDTLGGTIKIGKILTETKNIRPNFIVDQLPINNNNKNKFHFGFSVYQIAGQKFSLPKNFGLEIKRLLKEKNIASRLVTSREANLSSVTVAKNRLLKNGAEICFFPDKNQIYLGQTLAVQKFGEYSRLDYGRPGRDAFSGMLPPKVAKMMINLAGAKTSDTILDPFCGSGTILQQAALLNYKNLIGSDVSEKAIADTKENFQFLKITPPPLFVLDAKKITDKIKPKSVDAIITEPYLGPPQRGVEKPETTKITVQELSALYLQAFAEFAKVVKPNGKVIIIFPIIQNLPSVTFAQLQQIAKLGFVIDLNLPAPLNKILTDRQSLIYSREGQLVKREIFVFRKL